MIAGQPFRRTFTVYDSANKPVVLDPTQNEIVGRVLIDAALDATIAVTIVANTDVATSGGYSLITDDIPAAHTGKLGTLMLDADNGTFQRTWQLYETPYGISALSQLLELNTKNRWENDGTSQSTDMWDNVTITPAS